jgi:predicted acyltransferase (DUF342 family)
MKLKTSVLTAISLLAAASLLPPSALANGESLGAGSPPSAVDEAMNADVFSRSIFASSYVTLSAKTTVRGDVWCGAAATIGANAVVDGSTKAGAATTLGAGVVVNGDVDSGAATTLGATSWVDGFVRSGAATTLGAGAVKEGFKDGPLFVLAGGYNQLDRADPVLQDVVDAQATLRDLQADYLEASSTIAADISFEPGVHQFQGPVAVSAGTTITLLTHGNPNAEFIFNISSYVSFGAGVNVVMDDPASNARVIWNVSGTYISVGANANIVGTLLAKSYVCTGVDSTVSGVGTSGGGAFSATSYVTVGAGATVEGATHACGDADEEGGESELGEEEGGEEEVASILPPIGTVCEGCGNPRRPAPTTPGSIFPYASHL